MLVESRYSRVPYLDISVPSACLPAYLGPTTLTPIRTQRGYSQETVRPDDDRNILNRTDMLY